MFFRILIVFVIFEVGCLFVRKIKIGVCELFFLLVNIFNFFVIVELILVFLKLKIYDLKNVILLFIKLKIEDKFFVYNYFF